MKKRNNIFKFIFLVLLSLTPLIWFKGRSGILIDGVDTNFPLNPAVWFARRFFVWSSVGNLGGDFSASTAGTFFHLLQFIPFKLGLPLQAVELFSLIFWFGLIIFGSWFLSSLLFPKKSFPQLIFVCLYSFNIYLFNSFENVKVANLSLVSSIPLGLSILILLRNKKIRRSKAVLFSFLVGIVLAGSGINPAYIISFFLILALYVVSEVLVNLNSYREIIEILKDFSLMSLSMVVVNLFWILPTIFYILTNISVNNSISSIGFNNWVSGLSQNTSFVNVLRMQGAWDWYSVDSNTGMPFYIPYAIKYFTNPFFIGFSFLIPSLAFLAYLFKRKSLDSLYLFFGFALVIGLFLTSGTHPPTGEIFIFFGKHIPFFSLFRSPWYIFAPLIGLSIAGLVGLFVDRMYDLVSQKYILYFLSIIFIVGFLVYSYPLILGKIFRPDFNGSFYIKFPKYVFDTSNYLSKNKDEGRILAYPDDNIEKFKWGYSGVDSILNLFSDKEIVFSPLNDTETPLSQDIAGIYSAIKKQEIFKANSLANTLGIDKIFDKKDQVSFAPQLPTTITSGNKFASFGEWSFYRFPFLNPTPKIYSVKSLLSNFSGSDTSGSLSLITSGNILVNPADSLLTNIDLNNLGTIIKATNSQQDDLNSFQDNPYDLISKATKRDISSVEYNFNIKTQGEYSPILENYKFDLFGLSVNSKVNIILDGVNISLNINHSDDSYSYLSSLNLKAGDHKLVIPLENKNLINANNYNTLGKATFNFSADSFNILNKSNNAASFNFNISDFEPFSSYLVSIDSKYDYGKSPEIFINQYRDTRIFKNQQEVLPTFFDFDNYNLYFTPVAIPSTGEMHLVAPPSSDLRGTKVEFKNLKVYKLFTNDLFLKKDALTPIDAAKVTFTKNSPVSYSGEVKNSKNPQIIVFNENYSSNWELEVIGGGAKTFHFTANSYANAWYIKGLTGNYKFNIFYKPQHLLDIGRVIGIALVLGGIFWYGKKK
jgi:hypothetical protein